MKPRIFIGSSSEGLDVAKRVKTFLRRITIVIFGLTISLRTMNLF